MGNRLANVILIVIVIVIVIEIVIVINHSAVRLNTRPQSNDMRFVNPNDQGRVGKNSPPPPLRNQKFRARSTCEFTAVLFIQLLQIHKCFSLNPQLHEAPTLSVGPRSSTFFFKFLFFFSFLFPLLLFYSPSFSSHMSVSPPKAIQGVLLAHQPSLRANKPGLRAL